MLTPQTAHKQQHTRTSTATYGVSAHRRDIGSAYTVRHGCKTILPMIYYPSVKLSQTAIRTAIRSHTMLLEFLAWSLSVLTVLAVAVALIKARERDGDDEQ